MIIYTNDVEYVKECLKCHNIHYYAIKNGVAIDTMTSILTLRTLLKEFDAKIELNILENELTITFNEK